MAMNSWILSTKATLISTGVVSVAWIVMLSVPAISDFAVTEIPVLYSTMQSWLRPPYLYLIVNCIIISVLASSKLQRKKLGQKVADISLLPPEIAPTPVIARISGDDVRTEYSGVDVSSEYCYGDFDVVERMLENEVGGVCGAEETGALEMKMENKTVSDDVNAIDVGEVLVVLQSEQAPVRSDSMELTILDDKENRKLPLSGRFSHRRSVKASPNQGSGKAATAVALGVSKPKRRDTLESTWRTITEGRSVPLSRHLKKSDTWDVHGDHHVNPNDEMNTGAKMKKAENFTDGSNGTSSNSLQRQTSGAGSGKLRREPSLSQDELNRRVESFINKFNEEMRLQRQQSLEQYGR